MRINPEQPNIGSLGKNQSIKPYNKKTETKNAPLSDSYYSDFDDDNVIDIMPRIRIRDGEIGKTLKILHTNDLHGHISEFVESGEDSSKIVGGLSNLASKIREEKTKDPENTILLDAGDISTGGAVSDFFGAIPIVESMNSVGYDAMTVGNHDLDGGRGHLQGITEKARFPILSANMTDKAPDKLKVKPYIIKEAAGLKVGIIGLTTPDIMSMLGKEEKKTIEFGCAVDQAMKTEPRVREEGADLVVILSHLGHEKDHELAKQVDGIDVIIGGHSHTDIEKHSIENGTIITTAGSYGKKLGKLTLDVERVHGKTKVKDARTEMIPIQPHETKPDDSVKNILSKYEVQLESVMGRKIGKSDSELTQRDYHKYMEESLLANFVADAMKEKSDADAVIINSSGLRKNLPEGDITVGNVYEMFPWDQKMTTVKLKGTDIKPLLEEFLSGPAHTFAISGFKVELDTGKPDGEKVLKLMEMDNKPIDPEKSYEIASIDFLADGNLGLDTFKRASEKKDAPELVRDVLIEKIEKEDKIYAKTDGRIINYYDPDEEF